MAKKPSRDAIFFDRPMISAKAYVAKGPSGWPQAFQRVAVDESLKRFLGAVPVTEAVRLFVAQRALSEDQKGETWFTVIGFLGRLLAISPNDVPPEAGVAFWAQVLLERQADDEKGN